MWNGRYVECIFFDEIIKRMKQLKCKKGCLSMIDYKSKQELIDEILSCVKLFIDEFFDIKEIDKDKFIDGIDRILV